MTGLCAFVSIIGIVIILAGIVIYITWLKKSKRLACDELIVAAVACLFMGFVLLAVPALLRMEYCDCGTYLEDRFEFCPMCGKEIDSSESCFQCGKEFDADALPAYCSDCGAKVKE